MSEILSPALPVGYVLRDTYTITDLLGQGGFGITYLAEEDVTERRVVIKENYPGEFSMRDSASYTAGPAGLSRKEDYEWALGAFLNEAKVLTRLRHPNIVPVLTAFRAHGTAYYVMDYIGGKPLHEAAPRPRDITEQYLLSILSPLLSALHYLHTLPEPLLHRDIKPNNILVANTGTPILIDFGAARSTVSTHTHTKVGTPGYSPPEQWTTAMRPGPWTDLYALGATCYRLLTGQEPPDCHDRMFGEPNNALLSTRADLSKRFTPALLNSIDKAFALRPAERWQSAQEWLNALQLPPIPLAQPGTVIALPHSEQTDFNLKKYIQQIAKLIYTHHILNKQSLSAKPTKSPAPVKLRADDTAPQTAQEQLRRLGIRKNQYHQQLLMAAEKGDVQLLRLCIEAGADVNYSPHSGLTALSTAAYHGRAACVKLLLATPGIQVNKPDKNGKTPLTKAKERNHTICIKLLRAAGGKETTPRGLWEKLFG